MAGIGASAGGVEALRGLFAALPRDLPCAVLVVLHLSPEAATKLHHVIGTVSPLPVSLARHGEPVQAGHVYVAMPDRHLLLQGDQLGLSRGPRECRVRPAIDVLFRSLAAERGTRAAGVVLSGTLDDGTAGLWAIKEHGGGAFVQQPAEAMYPAMPASAIDHVPVDAVGGVASLAASLHAWALAAAEDASPPPPLRSAVRIENAIAAGARPLDSGVTQLGRPSSYTCPDCRGVLLEVDGVAVRRYRCHAGHAYTMKSLLAELDIAIDDELWDAYRSIEQRQMLLEDLAAAAARRGSDCEADSFRQRARALDKAAAAMRELMAAPGA